MEKRVVFRSGWLPWVLLAPQLLVISVFFFWPASQALLQSVQSQDAFGTSAVLEANCNGARTARAATGLAATVARSSRPG